VSGPALAALPLGFLTLTITHAGLQRFVSIALRSWVSVQAAVLLASTTSFPDLLVAMRALRFPRLLVVIIGLMWRYLFVIADEVLRLMRARAARSGQTGPSNRRVGGTLMWRGRVAGGMLGNLLLRSFERSDRIYNAMLARGYDGEVRTLPLPAVPTSSWMALGIGLLLLLALLGLGLLLVG
jgi:cobalt/nickel transport system permease protein